MWLGYIELHCMLQRWFSTADEADKETEGSPPLKKLKQLDLKQMKQGEKDKRYVYII